MSGSLADRPATYIAGGRNQNIVTDADTGVASDGCVYENRTLIVF